jgi:hypothetical protein
MRAFTAGVIVAVTALNFPAAPASATNVTLQSIMDASGQPVYDLQNSLIGTIRETRTINGVHSVVVATEPKFAGGSYDIAIAQSAMEPRSAGGWLVWLSDSAILWIPPYKPDAP